MRFGTGGLVLYIWRSTMQLHLLGLRSNKTFLKDSGSVQQKLTSIHVHVIGLGEMDLQNEKAFADNIYEMVLRIRKMGMETRASG